ncbi:hypothetical protein NLG97_g10942 [Lecanicillium saksenae]|uniref:Uncharacterized protein n=1 Tax=Lecanicillium saksenae TaxID=468837 RepID=A0ACC1QBS4_9HYPO|nr:hypothetical protein NLG97_g10942 [Lecanicillium saksenae]
MTSNNGAESADIDPIYQNLDWAIGQTLIMGWDGTEVTPQIRTLIEDHHLGSIILTAKNLKCRLPSSASDAYRQTHY